MILLSPSAPIPFPKPKPVPVQRLSVSGLVGPWLMIWGDTIYQVSLSARGKYECRLAGSSGTARWRGSWGVDPLGRLWISESLHGASWQDYVAVLDPGTLRGKIEIGSPGTLLRLVRIKAEKLKMPRGE